MPGIIEELQGTVMRKLQRQREVFEIDNTKLDKREKKIIARFERHKEDTYQVRDLFRRCPGCCLFWQPFTHVAC